MGTLNNIGNILSSSANGSVFGGSNGINVQLLLDVALAASQAPLVSLQQQQSALQVKTNALQSIQGDITNLTTAVSDLSSASGAVNSLTATSSNPGVLTASADPTALGGTHSIVVNSLATTSSYYTNPVASATTAIGTGSFQITVGSQAPVTITVNNTNNTLNGLAAAINGQSAGVTASVISDANGSRLALVSNTSGAPGNITISNDSTGLGFHQAVIGSNAALVVDGVPISSTSNTLSGVISGATIQLTGAAPGTTVSLTLSPDASQATKAINQFVTAWNKVMQDVNLQFAVTSSGRAGGPLEADSTLRGVQNQLLSAVTHSITGNNGFVNLASIGVNLNNDGTLAVNSGALSNALNNNFSSVHALLQGATGVATGLANTLNQITDPSNGTITLDLQGFSKESQDLTQQISAMQAQLLIQQQNLTNQYATMQTTLQEMPLLQNQLTEQLAALGH
jgi:flagellar hook-associated protein 2